MALLTEELAPDEKLPQMAALLDTARMAKIFERELAPGFRVEDCHIIHVRYRPGRNCVVSYRLQMIEADTGAGREQILSLLAVRQSESRERYALALQKPLTRTIFGEGVFHLSELEAVAWAFPNDRKLAGLPALADFNHLRNSVLPEIAAKSFGNELKVAGMNCELIQYVAERSCTVRADLELAGARSKETEIRSIFGKTYCAGESAAIWLKTRQLWESRAVKDNQLLIPQPLVHQPETETIWQGGLAGVTLGECEAQSDEFALLLEKAGAAVATLHTSCVPCAPLITRSDHILKLKAAEELLARTHPSSRQWVRTIIGRLTAASDRIGERPVAALHGDLHLNNFFVAGDRVALIDLDNMAAGDPLQDIGSFRAALHYGRLLAGKSFQEAEALFRRFVEAYRDAGGHFTTDALDWYTAAALIHERAQRCVTRLKVGGMGILDKVIALADDLSPS